jgi:small subunit ribosomal protein S13
MARIAGVDLPAQKRIDIALRRIYGVGRNVAQEIIVNAELSPTMKAGDLTPDEVTRIRKVLEGFTVEGDLRREIALNIKRLMDLGCYRGIRHRKGLPTRGQRTKTNSRTRKGPRKTVAGKKK